MIGPLVPERSIKVGGVAQFLIEEHFCLDQSPYSRWFFANVRRRPNRDRKRWYTSHTFMTMQGKLKPIGECWYL